MHTEYNKYSNFQILKIPVESIIMNALEIPSSFQSTFKICMKHHYGQQKDSILNEKSIFSEFQKATKVLQEQKTLKRKRTTHPSSSRFYSSNADDSSREYDNTIRFRRQEHC